MTNRPTVAIVGEPGSGKTLLAIKLRNDGVDVVEYEGFTEALRNLRLWHWQRAMGLRNKAKSAFSGMIATLDNREADEHIRFVQLLNNLFPSGDTAEQDATKAKQKR